MNFIRANIIHLDDILSQINIMVAKMDKNLKEQ